MKANPGGEIPANEVIGRDELIARIWRSLERQSVVLTAERRMGKTTVIKKMRAEPLDGFLTFYRDLEGIHTQFEFAESVFHDVESSLSRRQRFAVRARAMLSHLSGAEVTGIVKFPDSVAPHWKTLLIKTIEDLLEGHEGRIAMFWDEIPMMLDNIGKCDSPRSAMEMLDTLRALRQMNPRIRMIFAGSISLRNTIARLKHSSYPSDPTNDMDTIDVPPLSFTWGTELARRLIDGEHIRAQPLDEVAEDVARDVDCIPYFIQHVIDTLARGRAEITSELVRETVNAALCDPDDRWHFAHYLERLGTYYTPQERLISLHLLDALAFSDEPMSFNGLFNIVKSRCSTEDVDGAREIVAYLERDHYIMRQSNGTLAFRFSLIKRWWRLRRGTGR